MVKWALLTVVGIFAFLGGYLFFYLGAYKEPTLHGQVKIEFHMLAKRHIGPYHEINETIQEVEAWALNHNPPCEKTYGRYLDNPQKVEAARLRSDVGCLLSAPIVGLPKDLNYSHIDAREYLHMSFTGSPAISPLKVYPAAQEWLSQRGLDIEGAVIEVYRPQKNQSMTTDYYFPLGN
jgi:DNA gyrase inhibitor GyrI